MDVAVDAVLLAVPVATEMSSRKSFVWTALVVVCCRARAAFLIRLAKMRLQVGLELDVCPGLLARCVGLLPPTRRCGLVRTARSTMDPAVRGMRMASSGVWGSCMPTISSLVGCIS